MRATLRIVRLAPWVLAAHLLCAGEFTGTVARVQDGDALTILSGERTVRVRLGGIDSPEKGQAFGGDGRRFTAELALDKMVTVVEEDIDRYGRVVATVILADGRNLSRELVAAGWAWWFRRYAPDAWPLRTLESEARKNRLGLWAEGVPEAPWEWRKQDHATARADRRRSQPRSQRRDNRRVAR